MATLGRTLGPFGDARAAHEAADQAGLKLGLTVEELEVYMTRERKIPDGPRKGELETRVVPVALFELLDVHETHDFECSDGRCNQAGFLPHKYTPRGAHAAGSKSAGTDATAWRGVAWRGVAWRRQTEVTECRQRPGGACKIIERARRRTPGARAGQPREPQGPPIS